MTSYWYSLNLAGTGLMKGLKTEGQIIPDKPVEEMWNNTEYQERCIPACNFTQAMKK